ncbi:galactose mutarotase [Spirosoma taeanense]|uniref:Aldose 1-epimerase n=1 Tax=Spirosoma taeanense TaxID=2735870 RepID=A0A6M5Y6H2_9BACT|nr:aldose epimerase family protein [Spirosoma taeanense]QJW88960.1 galactose mutarotase [Spirosoma taeanense]
MKKFIVPAFLAAFVGVYGCQTNKNEQEAKDSIAVATGDTSAIVDVKLPDPEDFQAEINGKKVGLYFLKGSGMEVAITNYGARIVGLLVPDKMGRRTDVAPGFASLSAYQKANEPFYGPIVGRFGNRIAKGKFTLDGKTYQTELNNNGNTLHSGPSGFHTRVWDVKRANDKTIELTYVSKDGEGGFPGTVTTNITYSLTDDNGLKITYSATTDKATPYNPTSHGFFNLNGEGSGTVNNHILTINADRYSVVDKGLIPQGEPASVAGTPFDFRKPTTIGARINEKNEQLSFGGGYDHNWILNRSGGAGSSAGMTKAAEIIGDQSGIKMEVLTTEPAIQFYSGNFFKGNDIGKYGKATNFQEAFALETQHYPDSPNHPTYPNTILRPGQTYHQTTEYRFSAQR